MSERRVYRVGEVALVEVLPGELPDAWPRVIPYLEAMRDYVFHEDKATGRRYVAASPRGVAAALLAGTFYMVYGEVGSLSCTDHDAIMVQPGIYSVVVPRLGLTHPDVGVAG